MLAIVLVAGQTAWAGARSVGTFVNPDLRLDEVMAPGSAAPDPWSGTRVVVADDALFPKAQDLAHRPGKGSESRRHPRAPLTNPGQPFP
ncbi:MAG: hypothetical protein OXC93_17230, partial [Rhodospirillaceae bacterium]|nr:hypothetical protein [Rhodospirillaceae bacterium]